MKITNNLANFTVSPTNITFTEGGWTYREYYKTGKDLAFIKELCFLWPELLTNPRIKYIINQKREAANNYHIGFTLVYFNEELHGVTKIRLIDEKLKEPKDVPSDAAITPPKNWHLTQLENIAVTYSAGTWSYLLTLEGDKRSFWKPSEKWAIEKDALRESRGENVSNWADWSQKVGDTITYSRFWAWHTHHGVYDYIVPIYWELPKKAKSKE